MPAQRKDVVALRDAAVENAASLTDDAWLLLDAGRWAGAHGMATLALEEIGKAWLCQQKLVGVPGIAVKKLRTDHLRKAIAARQFMAMVAEAGEPVLNLDSVFGEHHDCAADDAHYLRMSGLYVDLTDLGVEGGARSVTEEDATESAHLAVVAVRLGRSLPQWELPECELGSDADPVGKPLKPPRAQDRY